MRAEMAPRPTSAPPAIRMPPIISRRGPKRSTIQPGHESEQRTDEQLAQRVARRDLVRDQPNSRTMKS